MTAISELKKLLHDVFVLTVPCLGLYELEDVEPMPDNSFVICDTPVVRRVSKKCQQVYKIDPSKATVMELLGIGMCHECIQDRKMEVKSEDDMQGDSVYIESPDELMPLEVIDEEDKAMDAYDYREDETWRRKRTTSRRKASRRSKSRKAADDDLRDVNSDALLLRNKYEELEDENLGNGDTFFRCPKCSQSSFHSKRALNYHRKRYHLYGPFLCPHCQDSKVRK